MNEERLPEYDRQWRAIEAITAATERRVDDDGVVDRCVPLIETFIDMFVENHRDRTGPIVVKTSTATLRARDHEPEERILDEAMDAIRRRLPDRELLLADGPAFASDYGQIAARHGWDKLAEKHRATVHDLNLDPADAILDGEAFISSLCREAAFTISIGKAKTHRRAGISGAEKAAVGFLSGSMMGYPKLECRHYLLPAIYRAVRQVAGPTLHIVDGIHAIEGNGPMTGTATAGEFLLIGEDPTALDVELSRLYCFDPALIISLFHSLEPQQSQPDPAQPSGTTTPIPTTLLTTERSMASMTRFPPRPPKEQPWLYRSLARRGSRRNRRNFSKIQQAFADVVNR